MKSHVFSWIEDKFKILSEGLDSESRYIELKNEVANYMREMIEINVNKTIELIENYYDDHYTEKLILGELSEYPKN